MSIGDSVLYRNKKAKVTAVKWGLCCIKFVETRKEIWVSVDSLTRQDF